MPIKLIKFLILLSPVPALAAGDCISSSGGYCANLAAIAQAQVPGLEFIQGGTIGQIISNIYVFGMSVVAISSLVMLVIAGVRYMSAGDNAGSAGEAKRWMGNAIFGLVLALLSWLILNTINPSLVKQASWDTNLCDLRTNPNCKTPTQ